MVTTKYLSLKLYGISLIIEMTFKTLRKRSTAIL